jgi:hypothetical protein
VLIETLVFNSNESGRHVFRQRLDLDNRVLDRPQVGKWLAPAVQQNRRATRLVRGQPRNTRASRHATPLPRKNQDDDEAGAGPEELRPREYPGLPAGRLAKALKTRARSRRAGTIRRTVWTMTGCFGSGCGFGRG